MTWGAGEPVKRGLTSDPDDDNRRRRVQFRGLAARSWLRSLGCGLLQEPGREMNRAKARVPGALIE